MDHHPTSDGDDFFAKHRPAFFPRMLQKRISDKLNIRNLLRNNEKKKESARLARGSFYPESFF